ncbi:MAG: elongation factor P [Phycisphaerales bacterium]|nr:elongation factor P [Phycisphaerales bacterium]
MKATDLRNGQGVKVDGKLYIVTSFEHRTPGNLRAFVQAKIRDVVEGKTLEKRFSTSEEIEAINLDRREMEYLYSDGSGATFMDTDDFDQIVLSADLLGTAMQFIVPNGKVQVLCYEGNPVSVDLPASVELEVTDTAPGIKGATATNQMKDATCETGLKTKVPPFITVGEKIRVSTIDGSYQSRA